MQSCHDLVMMSMILSNIVVLNTEGADYSVLLAELTKWDHKLDAKCWSDQKKPEHYKTN